MTPLARIHDRLVQQEGYECRCELWNCPAMKEAIAQSNSALEKQGQMRVGEDAAPGQMEGDDWGGYGE